METLIWCFVLAAVCFACGWSVGWNSGWWRGYADFAPSMREEREKEESDELA